jgi:hypothetical protein
MTKMQLLTTGVVAAATVALALTAQRQLQNQSEQLRLRRENQVLRERLAQLQEPARQPVGPQVDGAELESLRQGERELLRLRGEVSRLRQELQAASTPSTAAEMAVKARPLAEASKAGEVGQAQPRAEMQRIMDDISQKTAALHAQDLRQLASSMAATNPVAAIEFAKQLSPDDARNFLASVFASWARQDTDAALNWVDQQVSDPGEREAAIQAIRSAAPVGIGVQLRQDGDYAVVNGLVAGSPADTGGQLLAGDRILALAQGDDAFVDGRGLALKDLVQMIRGDEGTPIQLQVLPADAPLDSPPITVTVTRSQLKLKM